MIYKLNTALERTVKSLEGLNMFKGTNLTLISDVDPDTYGKVTKTRKHNTKESQEVNTFPAGDHKVARNRQESITNTTNKKWSTKEEPSWNGQQKSLEGLNMFNSINITLNSDVNQDT